MQNWYKNVFVDATVPFQLPYLHLADAFIQSDLQCIQATHFDQYVCSLGIEPTTFCVANAMRYHWATWTHSYMQIWTALSNLDYTGFET